MYLLGSKDDLLSSCWRSLVAKQHHSAMPMEVKSWGNFLYEQLAFVITLPWADVQLQRFDLYILVLDGKIWAKVLLKKVLRFLKCKGKKLKNPQLTTNWRSLLSILCGSAPSLHARCSCLIEVAVIQTKCFSLRYLLNKDLWNTERWLNNAVSCNLRFEINKRFWLIVLYIVLVEQKETAWVECIEKIEPPREN